MPLLATVLLSSAMMSFGTGTDTVNLKSQYAACSHNQLNFIPAPDPVAGLISSGAVTVSLPTVSVTVGDGTMVNAISAALNTMFGVSEPSQLADHVMYCLPPGTLNGLAYAYIDWWLSVFNNEWCTRVSAQVHEIGHNLALAHSNEGTQTYADQTGMVRTHYRT